MTDSVVQPKRCEACGHVLGAAQPPLTKREAELHRYICDAVARDGCAPSLAEIGQQFGWASLSTVSHHVSALERKGYVRRTPGVARGLTILVPFDEIGTVPVERRHG